jgi:hypothetical protein
VAVLPFEGNTGDVQFAITGVADGQDAFSAAAGFHPAETK